MDKKLTDSEIVKALECCMDEMGCKKGCPCFDPKSKSSHCTAIGDNGLEKLALDLINRLQAENERLQSILLSFTSEVETWSNKKGYDTTELSLIAILDEATNIKAEIKAEAYKECIEKVKALFPSDNEPYQYWEIHEGADNLLKELVGEE